ncbi:HEAT repeat domain-containing protein [Pseudomonas sp. Au-Pse12]|uniref:HEAT repeat domain-containing protein n=1 Tax=Pseudomonas sp. Au-Pse12 TaxID=2906459 RepID=UPI001E52C499|nr:HEAT repeat domain-containing protein [Pseudomonas sp. Au-Pse12]MCE4058194.1 HEAT repeat domain-containing protein [Pseudomonas sp. Au-Pse12]
MNTDKRDELFERLHHWFGDSEAANWNEYTAEQVAKGVLHAFTPAQWQRLGETLLSRPEYWQHRCAVSLGELRSPPAIDLLKRLLVDSPYLDVRVMAIYELDWSEVAIEHHYAPCILEIMDNLSEEGIEPELHSLLTKAESAAP